jgi:hypothetical protein
MLDLYRRMDAKEEIWESLPKSKIKLNKQNRVVLFYLERVANEGDLQNRISPN